MPIREHPDGTMILIVDDTPENLGVLFELLQPYYRVRAANGGVRALQIAQDQPKPDLILLDIMMPDLDGYAVIERLKADPATRDIPVIFVTALDDSEDEQRGLALGAVDYITKPIQPATVLARVRTHLELKYVHDRLREQNLSLEAEVARRHRQRESILMSTGEGIYGTDPDGRISFINPAAARMLGYQREELLGRHAHDTFHRYRPDGSPYPVVDCPIMGCLSGTLSVHNLEELFWRRNRRMGLIGCARS